MGSNERDKQWKIVEHIVASLFDEPDVQVRSNARLPAVRRTGGKQRRREIDVLLEGRLAGQRIFIPIECKNYRRKVSSPAIDAFIGKLQDIGLPTQTAIFVSTSGFAESAVARAHEVGIRTLVLTGANVDKTRNLILDAVQSHIYVGCQVWRLSFQSQRSTTDESDLLFFDTDGGFKGSMHDLLWQAWVSGAPPLICGKHAYSVEIPSEWLFREDGSPHQIRAIYVEFLVFALIKQYRGEASWHRLTDAQTQQVERQNLSLSFEASAAEQVPHGFDSEEELADYLSSQKTHPHIAVGRVRLPKLALNEGLLWPVPAKVMAGFERFRPEEATNEVARFRESSANNFWDFDDVYAQVLKGSQSGSWITLTPDPQPVGL